jgi:hypothetical protein
MPNPWVGGALLIVTDHIRVMLGKVKLGLTSNQSNMILYRYDNVLFCSVPFCIRVPFVTTYHFFYICRFVTVSFSGITLHRFVTYCFVSYRCVLYHCEMYRFVIDRFLTYPYVCLQYYELFVLVKWASHCKSSVVTHPDPGQDASTPPPPPPPTNGYPVGTSFAKIWTPGHPLCTHSTNRPTAVKLIVLIAVDISMQLIQ